MSERYFAASNSGSGFYSYFGEIFSPSRLEEIYIIKGGPGTGKSYFMNRVGSEAERRGRDVVYYYCSSDQSSLDGIVIDDSIAIFDGTSPHSADADIPGALHNILDLGCFWDARALAGKREEIASLGDEKKKHYFRAYRYLAAYKAICEAEEKLIEPLIDRGKMQKVINSIFLNVKSGTEHDVRVSITDSVGMQGRVRFDSLEQKARKIYSISDSLDTAHFFLYYVLECASEKELSVTVSYDPIVPERIDSVFLRDERILFASKSIRDGDEVKKINMSRFLYSERLSEVRGVLRRAEKLKGLLESDALECLYDAKRVHFRLEEIYKAAMDFSRKEEFTEAFIEKLF